MEEEDSQVDHNKDKLQLFHSIDSIMDNYGIVDPKRLLNSSVILQSWQLGDLGLDTFALLILSIQHLHRLFQGVD